MLAAGATWPLQRLELLAFKKERALEVWASDSAGSFRFISEYPILAASGKAGPKTRDGDVQVPEGIYGLPVLNPTSDYHVSIRVDYPNADDIANAEVPRSEMGSDIYIHGRNVSIGCLAMGDAAIEELFFLAAQVSPDQREIMISPVDFRKGVPAPEDARGWVRARYEHLRSRLQEFPSRSSPPPSR